MTTVTEFRERNTFCFCFRPITNRIRNSIAMNARLEGLNLWDRDVIRYLDSDRIPIFSPIEDFLFGVDVRWDGRDRIRELASRVPCNNAHWPDLFYRLVSKYGGTLASHRSKVWPIVQYRYLSDRKLIENRLSAGVCCHGIRYITPTALIS